MSAVLDRLKIADLWDQATEPERRKLLDPLLADVTVHPDRLQVTIHGAPTLNVGFAEVGLRWSDWVVSEGGLELVLAA